MRLIDADELRLHIQRHGILFGNEDATDEQRERYMLGVIEKQRTIDPESLRPKGQGCEYCNDPHPARDCVLPNGLERLLVVQDDGTFLGKPFVYHRKINYCPNCGAKMEG